MLVRRALLLAFGVSALTACAYRPGSFHGPGGAFVGERTTVGCLDVAVSPHDDRAAEGPALAYQFANRCDRPTVVDLGALVVRGRSASGRELTLAVWDPLGQLQPARIDGRRSGREVLEYRAAIDDPIALACVDLDRLDGTIDAPQELCVAIPVRVRQVAEVAL